MNTTIILVLVYFLGMVGRIVLPYVQERFAEEGQLTFDWRMVVGQAIGAFIGLVALFSTSVFWTSVITAAEAFSTIGPWAIYAAIFASGWFATDAGRRGDKLASGNVP